MKRILVLSFLPLILLALEKVNLIKDAGFEKDSDKWNTYTGAYGPVDSAKVTRHSSEYSSSGLFSALCDTWANPGAATNYDTAVVIQGFCCKKIVSDIDSLSWDYAVFPFVEDDITSSYGVEIGLYVDASELTFWTPRYIINAPDLPPPVAIPPEKYLEVIKFQSDTLWHSLIKGIRVDLQEAGISLTSSVDSIILCGFGSHYYGWRAQKAYWDNIRLTGYADYDVGVKGFVSKDSIGNAYTPTARIKNFGRKAADSFLVIATIEGGTGTVYADTLTWSLKADTEDTVSFKEFKPSDASSYTLTVSTIMTPDESDEDDAMSKSLYGTGISEPVPVTQPPFLQLEVARNTPSSLLCTYSLPLGEQGTISLYDPAGRRIEYLRVQGEGKVSLKEGLASGVYFVKLDTGHSTITKKAIILD